jgi:Zn-dependent alcohol dehydrogenase
VLTKAAVLFQQPGKWEVVELEPPRQGELLVKLAPFTELRETFLA